ncbi:MAG: electron transfer flavoprotein subunit alpha/FixB family protein [Polyangiaceae bacterium]|nr:electron transfer flavoprotein subunit alpha/FixB family protein [Myxococcales bacterium]MCB9583897.1 electron transfer flavoprotein subunit alpha/FixB family protein [Polyangiaceae bacterium]MCB9607847.1 electron transfer flavoprotein subunit alpha/FixB family protein [Polyangiaceae bacterium]
MTDVLVVAEIEGGKVKKTTLSAITMAKQAGSSFSILAIGGPGTKAAAADLTGYGATKVLVCEDASLANYVAEQYAPTVAEVGKAFGLVCATASTYGKDLIPRVAAKLDASYAGDCSGVKQDGGKIVYKRPMFAGNAFGYATLSTPIQTATARQSEFEAAAASGGSSPVEDVAKVAPGAAAGRVEFVSLDAVKSDRPELTDASVIVSGGRALKEKFFEVLEPLADVLGSALGASRAACDAGYCPGDFQVGQTGKIVAPKLYFAIGISGAIQHIAGMKGSKTIVAINKDPDAPIFQIADYGLVADLFQAVPELVEKLKAHKAAG